MSNYILLLIIIVLICLRIVKFYLLCVLIIINLGKQKAFLELDKLKQKMCKALYGKTISFNGKKRYNF